MRKTNLDNDFDLVCGMCGNYILIGEKSLFIGELYPARGELLKGLQSS